MTKFCAAMNLHPPLSSHPWRDVTLLLEDVSIDIRDKTCLQARLEAVATVKANNTVMNDDGSYDVKTGIDGSWQQRGWTSNQGLVAVIAQDTGKIMDVHHMVRSCKQCDWIERQKEKGKLTELQYFAKLVSHGDMCRKNHDGSPQSMEPTGNIEKVSA